MVRVFGPDVRLWARTELRRRWLSLVVLGVLSGVAAGLAIAAFDGAQRSSSAYVRMREQLHAADAILFPSQVMIGDFDARLLDGLPEVESWGGFSLNASAIDGLPPGVSPFIVSGDWFTTIEGAKVIAGRLPDATRDDEIVITQAAAAQAPDNVIGMKLVWRNLSLQQGQQMGTNLPADFDWAADAKGPVTVLTVVGIVRLPIESVAAFASDGLLLTGPGWAAAHLDDVPLFWTNAIVRLRNGTADLPALQADIQRLTGRTDIPIKDLSTDIKRVQRSLDLEHAALLMFAAAIAIAAFVLCGQAVIRATLAGTEAAPALRSIGVTTGALAVGVIAPMLVTIGTTIVVAAGVSVFASRWFPIGLARAVDPTSDFHVAAGREAIGVAVTAAAMIALVALAMVTLRQRRQRRTHRTHLMSAATRVGVPVPPAVGASLALDPSSSGNGRSRFAVIAAVAGVVAIFGALTLLGGINGVEGHPERTGARWDLVVGGVGSMSNEDAAATVAGVPDIADAAIAPRIATHVGGFDVPLYALRPIKGSLSFTVVQGRGPRADDEIALGPATLRLLRARVGDTIAVGPNDLPMRVVGVALLPQQPHSAFDEGGWTTAATVAAIAGPVPADEVYEEGLLRLADGVDPESAVSNLPPSWDIGQPAGSTDLANLLQVRHLPAWLALFVALLAVGAVSHTLFTSARQRGRELAVLRALGVTARGAAACISWQAIVTGAIALVVGIPLGVLAGWRLWQAITDQLSFLYVKPFASALVISATVTGCLVCCAVLAIIPARRTANRRIADTLRQE